MEWQDADDLNIGDFKRVVGVTKETFLDMVKVVEENAPVSGHKKGGKRRGPKPLLGSHEMLLVMLMYYREYRTFKNVGLSFGISESQAYRVVIDIEKRLIRSPLFHLAGKKKLWKKGNGIKKVAIDVTEHAIERPQNGQRAYYSGKKKKHTVKSQLVVDLGSGEVVSVAFGKGEMHDFTLFKESKTVIHVGTVAVIDLGYLGIKKGHTNSDIPKKKSKHNPLTKADKKANKATSRERIKIEHINRKVKVFKIMGERYRNRRSRFGLRINLICAIINYEL